MSQRGSTIQLAVAGGLAYLGYRALGGGLSELWGATKRGAAAVGTGLAGAVSSPLAGPRDTQIPRDERARREQEARDRAYLIRKGWLEGPDGALYDPIGNKALIESRGWAIEGGRIVARVATK